MEINRDNVIKIVKDYFLSPEKDYGQNYLIDPNISSKIVNLLDINEDDNILEIGPGIGSLTHFIALKKHNFSVIDIDQRMINYIKKTYEFDDISCFCSDIRKSDISLYNKIIANLPYNITSETIEYLLLKGKETEKLVLMCQTEAFPHFFDTEGKEYTPYSILVHLLGDIKREFIVKPGSFYPAPKCTSTVFTLSLKKVKNKEEIIGAYQLCKRLFINRRKTILNNLVNVTKDKDVSIEILKSVNIVPNKRPEEISPREFLALYLAYKETL